MVSVTVTDRTVPGGYTAIMHGSIVRLERGSPDRAVPADDRLIPIYA